MQPDGALQAKAYAGALASLRGEAFESGTLRLGESLTCGTARVEVSLAPVLRRSLGSWEALAVVLFAAVAVGQVAAACWLAVP